MLTLFVIVFSVMMLTIVAMAVGVLYGREPIKGSCGGLGAVGVERACDCVDVCQNKTTVEDKTTAQAKVEVYH